MSILLGYTTADFASKLWLLVNLYCFLVTVILFIIWASSFAIKLYYEPLNYVSEMFLVTDIASGVTTTYYRFKYIVEGDAFKNVLCNLGDIDKRLKSVGVDVPYVKDHITCAVFTILTVIVRVLDTYIFLHTVLTPLHVRNDMTTEFNSIYKLP